VSLGFNCNRDLHENGALHVIVKTTHGTLSNDCVTGSSPRNVLYAAALTHIADINAFLSCVTYHVSTPRLDLPHDALEIHITSAGGEIVAMRALDVLVFQHAVTVMAHTHGRIENMNRMAQTVQRWYPGTYIHCANDDPSVHEYSRVPELRWMPTTNSSGASFTLSTLLQTITTPFVLLLHDDMGIKSNSNLDVLLEHIYSGEYDIASPRIISIGNDANGGMNENMDGYYDCKRLDYIPDLFLARRSVLVGSQWNPDDTQAVFKVLRKLMNARIATCKHATVERF
jgi:hypothetical protein